MSNFRPKIIVTSGDPAGIGPDICLHLGQTQLNADITVLGDPVVFAQRAERLGMTQAHRNLTIVTVPTKTSVQAGKVDVNNVPMVLSQLDFAIDGCIRKQFDAMVTAPIHKGIINDSGMKFSGHTEYLAKKCGDKKPVMMLVCDEMRVALVTTHLPLAQVHDQITQNNLIHVLEILYNDLRLRFGISKPTIAVCGLNPHAGEQGHLGRTEIDIIEPTIELAKQSGMNILGPLPADTAFTPKILNQVDAVLTMYHDQGLPVLKYASFGKGVNITLGLPIVRSSVDHGTALDLAGTGRADPGSLIEAVEAAIEMTTIEREVRKGKRRHKSKADSVKSSALPNNGDEKFDTSGLDNIDNDIPIAPLKSTPPPIEVDASMLEEALSDNLPDSQMESSKTTDLEESKIEHNDTGISEVELDRNVDSYFFSELDILKALKEQSDSDDKSKEKNKINDIGDFVI